MISHYWWRLKGSLVLVARTHGTFSAAARSAYGMYRRCRVCVGDWATITSITTPTGIPSNEHRLRCKVASLRLDHVLCSPCSGFTLTGVGTLEGSFWSPSLGPTSTKDTSRGQVVLLSREKVALGLIAPLFVDRPALLAAPWAHALLNRSWWPRHRIIVQVAFFSGVVVTRQSSVVRARAVLLWKQRFERK